MDIVVVVLSLLSAAAFAVAAVLQQRAAARAPSRRLGIPLLSRLVREATWIAGFVLMLVGYGVEAGALRTGSLVIVEPLLTTNLVVALALGSRLGDRRLRPSEWAAAVATAGGVALFVVGRRTTGAELTRRTVPSLLALAASAGAIALMWAWARRVGPVRRAIMLGAAAGVAYGLADAFTKAVVPAFEHRGLGAFGSPALYLLAISGAGGVVIAQAAFHAANLRDSYPAMNVAEPLVGALLGIALFHETVNRTVLWTGVEGLAIVLMVVGVVVLSRSDLVTGEAARRRAERASDTAPRGSAA